MPGNSRRGGAGGHEPRGRSPGAGLKALLASDAPSRSPRRSARTSRAPSRTRTKVFIAPNIEAANIMFRRFWTSARASRAASSSRAKVPLVPLRARSPRKPSHSIAPRRRPAPSASQKRPTWLSCGCAISPTARGPTPAPHRAGRSRRARALPWLSTDSEGFRVPNSLVSTSLTNQFFDTNGECAPPRQGRADRQAPTPSSRSTGADGKAEQATCCRRSTARRSSSDIPTGRRARTARRSTPTGFKAVTWRPGLPRQFSASTRTCWPPCAGSCRRARAYSVNIAAMEVFPRSRPEPDGGRLRARLPRNDAGGGCPVYGVPHDWQETHGVRRYGFHGRRIATSRDAYRLCWAGRLRVCGSSRAISAAARRSAP